MNPHQKNKVDIKSLSPEEQRLFRLYGKLPSKSDHFAKHLKERKYFDSGDYAMSKAGKGDSVDAATVGSQHPVPENIPHASSPQQGGQHNGAGSTPNLHHPSLHGGPGAGQINSGSPVKESSFLQRETSVDDDNSTGDDAANAQAVGANASAVVDAQSGLPIRS
ncbi:camp-regulated phosphoprotein/endosulfine conserved region-domain-containing protein [Microdochium trichocladiopsis]|uniref:mRNA stability protein n=1 Tax=Microdochium trichocladiopsis TaxID=1682393 RepID=A0A9P9BKA0_9PEZI|nr:camp-regulated phosphoprotein/endosulfine conserved region-domain-containing protein [Microdochium trichocladiopsis]KAH7026424.1 camp-regulated phosphoprotein/endosulfine conserved region-domain-containing protein [Microdochium trichocladiopsis]